MIPIKTEEEIKIMREACEIAANVLNKMASHVKIGISTYELDCIGKKLIESYGAKSACYNYKVGSNLYPAYTCLSVNEEVVHGIGSLNKILQDGDIICLDISISYKGFIGDNAITVPVGCISEEKAHLLKITQQALSVAIENARPGNRVGDISFSVQKFVEDNGLSVVRDFVGHGIGRQMHEEPQIPNFGKKGKGPLIMPGMTFALEPMVNLGGHQVEYAADGWTVLTCDRKPSAHFEHTILICENGSEVLTKTKNNFEITNS